MKTLCALMTILTFYQCQTNSNVEKNNNTNKLSGTYQVFIGDPEAPTGQIQYEINFSDDKNFSFIGRGDEEDGFIVAEGKGQLNDNVKATGQGEITFGSNYTEEGESGPECNWTGKFEFEFKNNQLTAISTDWIPKTPQMDEDYCFTGRVTIDGTNLPKIDTSTAK